MNQSKVMRWALVLAVIVVLNLFFNFAVDAVYDQPDYEAFCPPMVAPLAPEAQRIRDDQCWRDYRDVLAPYNRNVFVVLVILGLIAFGISFFITASESVSMGLALGGVLSLVIASARYWSDMDEYLRVIVLGVALVALIWFGVKKLQDRVTA